MPRRPLLAASLVALLAGCGTDPATGPTPDPTCAAGEELFRGRCTDPAQRYEPAEALDPDNVVAYGDPLSALALPPPPKSGFRIIVPPRDLGPGEEVEYCVAWPQPKTTNHVVYAGRIHATPGLHHSNLIAKPVDPAAGANPYPSCNPGASDPFSRLPEVIPDVLFANSTQVVGQETLAFPVGMGYRLDPGRELITNIHLLNPTTASERVEVAYDFYTMEEGDLETEVAPFVLSVNEFLIPAHSTGDVGTTCPVFGGDVVSFLPHTHKLRTDFTVDFLNEDGSEAPVLSTGPFDSGSDIQVYQPSLDLSTVTSMRFDCRFDNTTDHDVKYGIGDNEMCILFGYLYPVRKQFVAWSDYQGMPCQSVQIGLFR